MGAAESKNGSSSEEENSSEDWMQADKYAEWECATDMDFNGTAMTVRHVNMPLNAEVKARISSGTQNDGGFGSLFTHEALVFEVMCMNGRVTKFTAEFTFSGVLKRWGHHKVLLAVKGHKNINLPMTEVLSKLNSPKKYDLVMYNCKHYAEEKYKLF